VRGPGADRQWRKPVGRYVASTLDAALAHAYARLRQAPVDSLLDIVASAECTLAQRIASGNLLALQGDPRIVPDAPAMQAIAGGEMELGLATDDVEGVRLRPDGCDLRRGATRQATPRSTVKLSQFRLARYPVTNEEHRLFLLDCAHAEMPTGWAFGRFPHERANHPVYSVTAASARAYARWLSRRTGRAFRLPTEAEWAWAACGHDGRDFPWGGAFDANLGNTAETGLFQTSAVGAFVGGQSPFGVFDMAGNVEEFVVDPRALDVVDAVATGAGRRRAHRRACEQVARGGSFACFAGAARNRRRRVHELTLPTDALGFRLAETV
jgi:formylglycine-generating enzyme required for sulfatase activity